MTKITKYLSEGNEQQEEEYHSWSKLKSPREIFTSEVYKNTF